jgi:hypothetical protein
LIEQTCGVVLPTYGRNGLVKGTISLRECSEVVAVHIKVSGAVCVPTSHASCEHKPSQIDGRLNVEIADGGTARTTFLTAERTIWIKELRSFNDSMCPSVLPFEWAFPSTYQDRGGKGCPVPPSYEILSPGDPKVAISCKYTLTVEAVKTQVFPLLKRRKRWNFAVVPNEIITHRHSLSVSVFTSLIIRGRVQPVPSSRVISHFCLPSKHHLRNGTKSHPQCRPDMGLASDLSNAM